MTLKVTRGHRKWRESSGKLTVIIFRNSLKEFYLEIIVKKLNSLKHLERTTVAESHN